VQGLVILQIADRGNLRQPAQARQRLVPHADRHVGPPLPGKPNDVAHKMRINAKKPFETAEDHRFLVGEALIGQRPLGAGVQRQVRHVCFKSRRRRCLLIADRPGEAQRRVGHRPRPLGEQQKLMTFHQPLAQLISVQAAAVTQGPRQFGPDNQNPHATMHSGRPCRTAAGLSR
jgi:hypothetical protein